MRILFMALPLMLLACGQKGQLYLPGTDDPAITVPATEAPAAEQASEESTSAKQDANKQKKD